MKVKFLGSGSAFTFADENFQSNILISKEVEDLELHPSSMTGPLLYEGKKNYKHLLYDAGETCAEALKFHGLVPQDLDTIYISHLHGDHSGGIESIAFKTYFQVFNFGKTEFGSMKPKLKAHHSILRDGWDTSWKGGLQSIQGQTNNLETYFDTEYMPDNGCFDFYGATMKPIQTFHVKDDRRIVPSYGMIFEDNYTTCFITGDSQHTPEQLHTEYSQANIIFQDCELIFEEKDGYKNGVHAQYWQLNTLNKDIKEKMWLYHYALNGRTYEECENRVINDGFAGLVKRGQEFII